MMEKILVVTVLIATAVGAAFDWTKPNVIKNEGQKNMEDLVTDILKEKGFKRGFAEEVSVLKETIKQQELQITDLTNHVTRLNKVVEKQDILIKNNAKENAKRKSFVQEQENQISKLDKHIEKLEEESLVQKQHSVTKQSKYANTDHGMHEVEENMKSKVKIQIKNSSAVKNRYDSESLQDKELASATTKHPNSNFGTAKQARRLVAGEVAFSAYLSMSSHYVSGHTVKYDQVLTNYGNGYNKYTGVFSAPTTGVYLLTFSIATVQGNSHIRVKLVYNNSNIADASADPGHASHVDMGGNTVIVDLTAGQSVWLEVYDSANGQMASSSRDRYATFSGVKLF